MFVVGLTGGIGSGKSTIAKFFAEKNIVVIEADQRAREVVKRGTPAFLKISDRFGPEILTNDGFLNRKRLREIVFSDGKEKAWLENLLHPLINEALIEMIKAAISEYIILESPLLLETNQHELVDRILVVDVSEKTQLTRTLNRDGGSENTIKAIMNSQLPRAARLKRANDIIDNEQQIDLLNKKLESLHKTYITLANKR